MMSASAPVSAPLASTVRPSSTPSAPPLPDEYADCTVVRRADGSALAAAEIAEARSGGWLWPPKCGRVSGWAGIGMSMSTQATAFSADGKRFIACGAWGDICDVLDLTRDAVVQRVTIAWPGGIDGSPRQGRIPPDRGAPSALNRRPNLAALL